MTEEITRLRERLEAAERELKTLCEAKQPQPEPQEPHDPEREFAEQVLAKLNESRTPWISSGGQDAA